MMKNEMSGPFSTPWIHQSERCKEAWARVRVLLCHLSDTDKEKEKSLHFSIWVQGPAKAELFVCAVEEIGNLKGTQYYNAQISLISWKVIILPNQIKGKTKLSMVKIAQQNVGFVSLQKREKQFLFVGLF